MTSPLRACWRCGEFMMAGVRKKRAWRRDEWDRVGEIEKDKGANEFETTRDWKGVGGGERVIKLQKEQNCVASQGYAA